MADSAPLTPLEEDYCACISVNRMNLSRFTRDFATAVQLFELLERGGGPPSVGVFGGVFIQYRIIASKEGALSIYHFGCSLNAIRGQIYLCPRTRNTVDANKVKEAFSLFSKYFPHANNTRHAVAHAGEIWASPNAMNEHKQKEDYISPGISSAAGGFLTSALQNRTYSIGYEGKVFEVHMDASTVHKLVEITNLALSAFPA